MNGSELEHLSARFLEAQLAGDRVAALSIVLDDGLQKGASIRELHLGVIARAQLEIGRLWQENRVTVAEEHLATAIAQLALARLYPHLPRTKGSGKRVVIACVEGEHHDMGPRICADFLEMEGFDVRFLGADVPSESLAKMVAKEKPDVVVLSMTLPIHRNGLQSAVEAVRAVAPSVHIVAGGKAFSWDPKLGGGLDLFDTGVDVDQLVAATGRAAGLS
jgi:methanogenic corrinoid protein MtbC1